MAEEQSLPEVTLTVRSWPKGSKPLNYVWPLSNPAPRTIEAPFTVLRRAEPNVSHQRPERYALLGRPTSTRRGHFIRGSLHGTSFHSICRIRSWSRNSRRRRPCATGTAGAQTKAAERDRKNRVSFP